jgi:hypothetical protein
MQAIERILIAIGHYSHLEKTQENEMALQELCLAVEQMQVTNIDLQLLRSALSDATDTIEKRFLPAVEDKESLIEQIEEFRVVLTGEAARQTYAEELSAEIGVLFDSLEFPCSDEEYQAAKERLSELKILNKKL